MTEKNSGYKIQYYYLQYCFRKKTLRYSMYNDRILYVINEWSVIYNPGIILKVLSDKNTLPKEFHKFWLFVYFNAITTGKNSKVYQKRKQFDVLKVHVEQKEHLSLKTQMVSIEKCNISREMRLVGLKLLKNTLSYCS